MYSSVDSAYYPGVWMGLINSLFLQDGPEFVFVSKHVFPHKECSYYLPETSHGVYEGKVTIKKGPYRWPVQNAGMHEPNFASNVRVNTFIVQMTMNGNGESYTHPVTCEDADNYPDEYYM
jgi:hypothetical protein